MGGGWEIWPLSLYSLSRETGSHLGCGMHLVGKELGAGGREWEESPTGAGNNKTH